jgi:hypothetical protein
LKRKIIEPPFPTEERLLDIHIKKLTFGDGRVVEMRMSKWHWKMLEYLDQANDWTEGNLKTWVALRPDESDHFQSDLAMLILRDEYELYRKTWVQEAYADKRDLAADNRLRGNSKN